MRPAFTAKYISTTCLLLIAAFLTSCNTVSTQTEASVEQPSAQAVDTLTLSEHIFPKVQLNASGELQPYTAQTNPYDLLPSPSVEAAVVSQFKQALKAKDSGDYKAARKYLADITKANPELSGPWYQLGEIARLDNNFAAAETAYQAAISANDWNTWAWLALGITQRQLGNMENAQASYLGALQRWPDFADAHKNLAILLDVYLNQAEAAQAHFEAYQVLTAFKDEDANDWVTEIQRRTGVERALPMWQSPLTSDVETTSASPTTEENNG